MHSLSEQVVVLPGIADHDESTINLKLSQIAESISEKTGWTQSGNILYLDSEHKFHIDFSSYVSGSYIKGLVSAYFNNTIGMNPSRIYDTEFILDQQITIRIHRSKNEFVTYINIGNNPINTFIFAKNENGEDVLFRGTSSSNSGTPALYVGANALSAVSVIGSYQTSGARKYSVAKYTDNFSIIGGEFAELYWVYATVSPQLHDQLISFGDVIMRLITINLNVATMTFAFPVSDIAETTPEEESQEEGE